MSGQPEPETMLLKIMTPIATVVQTAATTVSVEAIDGSRGFLPRHIDFVTALDIGILVYRDSDGIERFVGVDGGVLVKKGRELSVSTNSAVQAESMSELVSLIQEQAEKADSLEREARTAVARLETGLVKRFIELAR